VICYAHSFVGVTDELFVPLFPCSKTTKLATKLASFSLHFWTQLPVLLIKNGGKIFYDENQNNQITKLHYFRGEGKSRNKPSFRGHVVGLSHCPIS